MKRIFTPTLILFVACLGALLGAPKAYASSVYDTTLSSYTGTSPFTLSCSGCTDYDASVSRNTLAFWQNLKYYKDTPSQQSAIDDFANLYLANISTGKGYEWSRTNYTGTGDALTLTVWTNPDTATAQFASWGGGAYTGLTVTGGTVYAMTIALSSTDVVTMVNGSGVTNTGGYLSWSKQVIQLAYDLVYPDGYAGAVVPTTLEPPRFHSNEVPIMQALNSASYLVTFSDKRFNTFDGTVDVCGSGLAPALHYEVFNETGTESLLSSGVGSATAQFTYQLPKLDTDTDYRIVGWYDCGSASTDPIFDYSSNVDFTVSRAGLLKIDIFTTCIKSDFPYVDVNGCMTNLGVVISMISFNTIGFANNWQSDTSCHTLGILGDWLHLQDKQVCPEFSPGIRDVVTPFVTLLLGLLMISFIARNRGSSW